MLISIIAYIICTFLVTGCVMMANSINGRHGGLLYAKRRHSFWSFPLFLSIIIFGVFYGVRYNTGPDNLTYIETYCEYLNFGKVVGYRDGFEAGYTFILELFSTFRPHFSVFIGFWGVLQIGALFYVFKNDRKVLLYLAPFIILSPFFLEMSNIMRQTSALCIFFIFFPCIEKKQLFRYLIGVSVCVLIHKSAVILYPLYFIMRFIKVPGRKTAVIIFIICTLIGNTPFWINELNRITAILNFIGYDRYGEGISLYTEHSDWSIAWGPSRFLSWLMILQGIWYFYEVKKKNNLPELYNMFFTCFFYGACLYNILINTHQVFLRPVVYFYDFYVLVLPIVLCYFRPKKTSFKWLLLLVSSYFYSIYMSIHGSLVPNSEFEVYHFFFL